MRKLLSKSCRGETKMQWDAGWACAARGREKESNNDEGDDITSAREELQYTQKTNFCKARDGFQILGYILILVSKIIILHWITVLFFLHTFFKNILVSKLRCMCKLSTRPFGGMCWDMGGVGQRTNGVIFWNPQFLKLYQIKNWPKHEFINLWIELFV